MRRKAEPKAELRRPELPKRAQYDRDYILLEDCRGYKKGQLIRNWPRPLLQQGLDEGWLKEA